jgi:hypothetical protein
MVFFRLKQMHSSDIWHTTIRFVYCCFFRLTAWGRADEDTYYLYYKSQSTLIRLLLLQ